MSEGFEIFGWTVRYYGIIIMGGVLLAAMLAAWRAKKFGRDPEIVWDLLVWLIIGGIIGARLWHVFTPPPSSIAIGKTTLFYLTHPFDLIDIRNGGMGLAGGVIGGAIALYFFTRKYKLSFAEWVDIAAPSLAMGQAIGRWGNFVNQELYGAPTDLPWAIFIEPHKRVSGFADYATYHPLFLYEALWNLGNMALLLWLSHRFGERLKPGDVFLTYLVVYPVGRFLLDFLRLDASMLGGINANQAFMAAVAVLAAGMLFWRHRKISA
jgi:phosphatidylglycerol---prolipoprotein diacylglyceryl transferase